MQRGNFRSLGMRNVSIDCRLIVPPESVPSSSVLTLNLVLLAFQTGLVLRFFYIWWVQKKKQINPSLGQPSLSKKYIDLSAVTLKVAGCTVLVAVTLRKLIGENTFPCWVYRFSTTFAALCANLPHVIALARLHHEQQVAPNLVTVFDRPKIERRSNTRVFASISLNGSGGMQARAKDESFALRSSVFAAGFSCLGALFVHALLPIDWYCDGGCMRTTLHFGVALTLGMFVALATVIMWIITGNSRDPNFVRHEVACAAGVLAIGITLVITLAASGALKEPEYELIEVVVVMLSTVVLVELSYVRKVVGRQPINSERCQIDSSCTLQTVLDSNIGRELLRKHLASEYAVEGLYFLESVEAWKSSFETDAPNTRIQKATQVQKLYVDNNAPDQINVPEQLRELCDEGIAAARKMEAPISIELFDELYEDVITVISRDSFPRFKQSALFEAFVKSYVC